MIEGFEAAHGAIITIEGNGQRRETRVPAVMLFDTSFGFAWIEPAYLSPDDFGSGLGHRIPCTLTRTEDGFEFSGPMFFGSITSGKGDPAIEEAHAEWKRRRISLAVEREKFRADLSAL